MQRVRRFIEQNILLAIAVATIVGVVTLVTAHPAAAEKNLIAARCAGAIPYSECAALNG